MYLPSLNLYMKTTNTIYDFIRNVDKMRVAGIFAFLVLLVSCYMPSMNGFSDNLILPKWYFFTASMIILLFLDTVFRIRERRIIYKTNDICWLFALTAFVESIIFIYAVFCGYIPLCGLFGTFDNPAGFACCLSISLPFYFYLFRDTSYSLFLRSVIAFMAVFVSVAIIVSGSRTGLISIVLVAVLMLPLKHTYRKVYYLILLMAIIGLCFYCLNIKQDSTSGRFFIFERSLEMIEKHPFIGYGYGGFMKNYMNFQAEYFRNNPDSVYSMLAGEVRHPLNEFLMLWINWGIAGLFFMIAMFLIPPVYYIRKNRTMDIFVYALLPVFIFSLFSYPFKYPLPWLVCIIVWVRLLKEIGGIEKCKVKSVFYGIFICCLFSAFLCLCNQWSKEYRWSRGIELMGKRRITRAMNIYDDLYPDMTSNPYFLYNYAAVLQAAGHYEESQRMARRCRRYWADYDLEVMMGDNFRHLGDFRKSEDCYRKAARMCPSRFLPLYKLYVLYGEEGDLSRKKQMAEKILDKPMKIETKEIRMMRARVKREW